MHEYLMINHGTGEPARWDDFFRMLHDLDAFVGGSALEDGITLTRDQFTPAGPSSITGYILIRTASLAEAREIMLRNPVHLSGGTVELYELVRT